MGACIISESYEISPTTDETRWSLYTDSSAVLVVVLLYLTVEVLFFLYHFIYIIPRANLLLPPQDYLDYGRERHKLLVRILNRIQQRALKKGTSFQAEFNQYLQQWFHLPSASSSDKLQFFSLTESETRELLCWAFFGKQVLDVKEEDWEMTELNKLLHILKEEYSVEFEMNAFRERRIAPKLVSLEKVNPIPRPLAVYLAFKAFECLGGFILRMHGFQRYTTPTHGLGYWFNSDHLFSSNYTRNQSSSPLLFFHGLAPAGSTVYIPLVLYGLCRNGEYQNRPIFFFENKNISYGMSFSPVFDEVTAVESVIEALEAHSYYYKLSDSNYTGKDIGTAASSSTSSPQLFHISVCGHSFGTCVATWLLRSPKICHMIKNVVLLDPVSILLSEPDVMNNFLYKPMSEIIRRGTLLDFAIFFVSRTEVFTEHYLRRHFSWYNSELWLEDIHNANISTNMKLLVALSGQDEIVNSSKVQEEIEIQISRKPKMRNKVKLIFWPKSGHASCISDTSLWKELQTVFHLQEKVIESS